MAKSFITRKDSIILTAIEIIDQLGLKELSIREIAGRQGVSEPAIYRHFTSKQDLLASVLNYYSKFDSMIFSTITSQKMNSKDGIMFFFKSFAEYYENYPAITSLLFIHDMLKDDSFLAEKMEIVNKERFNFIMRLIQKGQKNNEISEYFNAKELSKILIGTGMLSVMSWRMAKCEYSLKESVLPICEKILASCKTADI